MSFVSFQNVRFRSCQRWQISFDSEPIIITLHPRCLENTQKVMFAKMNTSKVKKKLIRNSTSTIVYIVLCYSTLVLQVYYNTRCVVSTTLYVVNYREIRYSYLVHTHKKFQIIVCSMTFATMNKILHILQKPRTEHHHPETHIN